MGKFWRRKNAEKIINILPVHFEMGGRDLKTSNLYTLVNVVSDCRVLRVLLIPETSRFMSIFRYGFLRCRISFAVNRMLRSTLVICCVFADV